MLGVLYPLLMDYYEGVDHLNDEKPWGTGVMPISQSQSRESMNSKFIWRTLYEPQPLLQLRLLGYSQRSLTYGSDALDAFRGILSRSKNFSYHGIPIFGQIGLRKHGDGPSASFAFSFGLSFGLAWARFFPLGTPPGALLDSPSGTDGRRHCFPSWSWTSIRGVTAFALAHESFLKSAESERLHFDEDLYSCYPRIKVEDKDGRVHDIEALVAAHVQCWMSNKGMEDSLELGTKAGQIDPRVPERSNLLWLHGYRAKCFVVFHGPGYMNCIDEEALQSLVVSLRDRKPSEAFEQGRLQVNIYWDNYPHDFNNAEPTSQWNLVLLLRKRSKMHNYETAWWLLVNSTTRDDGTLNAHRVGLVRTWSRPRKGFPIEDAVVRLA